jgi:hypothetical protein
MENGVTGPQHTNTRTLDRALDDAVARLTKLGGKAAEKLIGRAERYREKIAIWEHQPPKHTEQDEAIEEIMHLLSQAMLMTRGISSPPPPLSDKSPSYPPTDAVADERPSRPGDPTADGKGVVLGRMNVKK